MNYDEAMEIKQSTGVIEVLYKGIPVWIEEINGDKAVVSFLQSGIRQEVHLQELVE